MQLRRRALRAALQLIMGQPDLQERTRSEVLEVLRASTKCALISVGQGGLQLVRGGDTLAIALKQLATNACRHDGVVALSAHVDDAGVFRLQWDGNGPQFAAAIHTSRHPDQRDRWGLGMVRLAADALGATVRPVWRRANGRWEAAIEMSGGGGQLTLPLAAIEEDCLSRVSRATRAWDEETGATPGHQLPPSLVPLAEAVSMAPGRVVSGGAYVARCAPQRTWMALRPRSHRDQARDLFAGLVHEMELVGDVQDAADLLASATALRVALGVPELDEERAPKGALAPGHEWR